MGRYIQIYSVCSHGNTDVLIDELLPLLERYQGHYISGHDHCMEHIQPSGSWSSAMSSSKSVVLSVLLLVNRFACATLFGWDGERMLL
jgi:hypothetical protein